MGLCLLSTERERQVTHNEISILPGLGAYRRYAIAVDEALTRVRLRRNEEKMTCRRTMSIKRFYSSRDYTTR
jgi:hypothetical protein